MYSDPVRTSTQKGVITRTLGNLISVWPLNVHQQKELVFTDMAPISSQYLKVGDWIQMDVECGEVVVYREKIENVRLTYVSEKGRVRVKTRLYFPNGLETNDGFIIGYSDDFGRVGVFFRCPELKAEFSYYVWVSRIDRKRALFEEQNNVHWCLVRQTLIPSQCGDNITKPMWRNWSVDDVTDQFNNTLTESNINSREIDFPYILSFNDKALRRFYNDPGVREAVRQHSSDFARSIETYLSTIPG